MAWSDDDEDYEPSQIDNDSEKIGLNHTWPIREAARIARSEKRIARQFAPGGALDSQTTDSQFVTALLGTHTVPLGEISYHSVATQTDLIHSDNEGLRHSMQLMHEVDIKLDTASPLICTHMGQCSQCSATLQQLRNALRHCELLCREQAQWVEDLQDIPAYGEQVKNPHDMVAYDPAMHLDPDEQSQVLMEAPKPVKHAAMPLHPLFHSVPTEVVDACGQDVFHHGESCRVKKRRLSSPVLQ
ncbi:hypothetical protein A0H81_00441 [Grifola frondosa]|uniref:Uncharacterized protein n=1 Tax=Grifola frondosa TaxID=5627 RepID=A0A1C7MT02_GRIFR|nr:hypothetical protein A0H81_00441 [Grifola frondosa]